MTRRESRGLEPSGLRGSDARILLSDNGDDENLIRDPSDGAAAAVADHSTRPPNNLEGIDGDEEDGIDEGNTAALMDGGGGEPLDRIDSMSPTSQNNDHPTLNGNGSFGREIKTHDDIDEEDDIDEDDDGEVVLDEHDNGHNEEQEEEEDSQGSQFDEEDEVTPTSASATEPTSGNNNLQQDQHNDAAHEASRALSRLQLQGVNSNSHDHDDGAGGGSPPPGIHSGAVVPLGIPPVRTPSPQLNCEETALTVLPPNELSATTGEAAMAANTFADMMGGSHGDGGMWGDPAMWGEEHHDGGMGLGGRREGPPGLVVDGRGVVRRTGPSAGGMGGGHNMPHHGHIIS